MGMTNYTPTDHEVRSWMKLYDTNGDNRVSLEEYEEIVIRSLKSVGIAVEMDYRTSQYKMNI